ncbi:MAG: c-type cytochrome [Flavobacteriales bacterium]
MKKKFFTGKKMMVLPYFGRILPALLLAVIISQSACIHDHKKPAYVYFPDMDVSDAYETYDPNPNFPDGKTAQSSVEGTIPREIVPYPYPKTPEGMELAGEKLKNPFEPNEKTLARGKAKYDIYCGICHGEKGNGEGLLYKSGKYPAEPASLVSKDIMERPDGELFHVITMGSAIMGAHAAQIRRADRWKIILYIKHVLQKDETARLEKEAEKEKEGNSNESK